MGFEPTVTFLPRSISSRVPSTGLSHPSLFYLSGSADFCHLCETRPTARSLPSQKNGGNVRIDPVQKQATTLGARRLRSPRASASRGTFANGRNCCTVASENFFHQRVAAANYGALGRESEVSLATPECIAVPLPPCADRGRSLPRKSKK